MTASKVFGQEFRDFAEYKLKIWELGVKNDECLSVMLVFWVAEAEGSTFEPSLGNQQLSETLSQRNKK